MIIKYQELKEAVYIMMALAGIFFIICSLVCIHASSGAAVSSSHFLSGTILFLAGILSIFFSLVTFLIRDDPDVWQ